MTDSVVAWYSSASMKSSREDASPGSRDGPEAAAAEVLLEEVD